MRRKARQRQPPGCRTNSTLLVQHGQAVTSSQRVLADALVVDKAHPGLDRRAGVGQEGEMEMTRALAVEGEAVHTLRRIGLHVITQVQV